MNRHVHCRRALILAGALLAGSSVAMPLASGGWEHREVRRFKAAEANQGVAVDGEFFYAIDTRSERPSWGSCALR
jgi:hypothetical protein